MDRTTIDLWVGVFVALGVAALLGLAMKVGNLTSSKIGETYNVTAAFENIGGLKPNAPVKSAGVVVGRVKKIEFDGESFQAKVTLALQSEHAFPQDSSLKILTSGLLGEQYLDVSPGADEKNLVAGDKIASTQSAVILENLISQFLYSQAEKPAAESQKP